MRRDGFDCAPRFAGLASRVLAASLALTLTLGPTRVARAQPESPKTDASSAPPSPATASAAEQAELLFREAKLRMADKRYAEACGLFAESQRLDPAPGTLLALAACHEADGRLATAWAEYTAVAAQSRVEGRADREEVAKQRASEIEPKLGHLKIELGDKAKAIGGLRVRRDGAEIGAAVLGIAIPVDPGEHLVESTAEGRVAFKRSIKVDAGPTSTIVRIDDLDVDPSFAPAAPPAIAPVDARLSGIGDTQRVAGFVSLGLGVVGGGLATVFAVQASSQASDAEKTCPRGAPCHDANAAALSRSSVRNADVATGLLVGAGVAAAVGLALVILAPRAKKTARAPALLLTF